MLYIYNLIIPYLILIEVYMVDKMVKNTLKFI